MDAARIEKLKGVVRKIFLKYGKIVTEHYPVDEEGKTKGYMFLEFSRHQVCYLVNIYLAIKIFGNKLAYYLSKVVTK